MQQRTLVATGQSTARRLRKNENPTITLRKFQIVAPKMWTLVGIAIPCRARVDCLVIFQCVKVQTALVISIRRHRLQPSPRCKCLNVDVCSSVFKLIDNVDKRSAFL